MSRRWIVDARGKRGARCRRSRGRRRHPVWSAKRAMPTPNTRGGASTPMKPCSRNCFGLGWPDAPHRVIPNAATRRWIGQADRRHRWIRKANHAPRYRDAARSMRVPASPSSLNSIRQQSLSACSRSNYPSATHAKIDPRGCAVAVSEEPAAREHANMSSAYNYYYSKFRA